MNHYVKVYNVQTGGIHDYILIQVEGQEKMTLPILYYWLKSQGKEGYIQDFLTDFHSEFTPVVLKETEEKGEKIIKETYGKYFSHYKITEQNLSYLKDLSIFLEFFHSDQVKHKIMMEKTEYALKSGRKNKDKFYIDEIGELLAIYKKFIAFI